MCRNIRTLANFEPPATDAEVRAAALQFVRKLSGMQRPSRANVAAFDRAVEDVSAVAARLLHTLETSAPPKDRVAEAAKARARTAKRFGRPLEADA
jgi:hypothetical protein